MGQRDARIKKNLFSGLVSQMVGILLSVFLPKLLIENYGSEVNGLLSSVTNLYAYLAIVETGVAAASCQGLYQAFANESRDNINAIMAATNRYYYRSGVVYLALVLVLSAAYPIFAQTSLPTTTVVLIVFLNGISNVINYFFYGKYLILLKADGKNYVRIGIETAVTVLKQISKIVLILLGFDVIMVQVVALLANAVQMIFITYYIRRNYPWIDLRVVPNNAAIKQNRNAIIHELQYLITNNTDVALLTLFSTMKEISVYSLYAMLVGMIDRVLRIAKDSLEFKIANFFHTDKEKFNEVFHAYEVYYISSAFALFTIFAYFCRPFIAVYTKGITDAEYTNVYYPFMFAMIGMLVAGRYPYDALVYIAGHFKQTQKSAIIEASMNLGLSIVLVQRYGIIGVLFGTIVSAAYRTLYQIAYVSKYILCRNARSTYRCLLLNLCLCGCILYLSSLIPLYPGNIVEILVYCVPYSVVVVAIYIASNSLVEQDAYHFLRRMLGKRKMG